MPHRDDFAGALVIIRCSYTWFSWVFLNKFKTVVVTGIHWEIHRFAHRAPWFPGPWTDSSTQPPSECCGWSPSRKCRTRTFDLAVKQQFSRTFNRNVITISSSSLQSTMTQERTIPGCPWAFADDMRGIIDKKEFRFGTFDRKLTWSLCKQFWNLQYILLPSRELLLFVYSNLKKVLEPCRYWHVYIKSFSILSIKESHSR